MMHSSSTKLNFLLVLLVGVLTFIGAWGLVHYEADFRYFLFLAILLVLIITLALGKQALWVGFIAWIWMFILGYRTIHVTPYLSIHPLMVLLLVLFILLLFTLKLEPETHLKLPKIIGIFAIFWIWGFIPGVARGTPWSQMLSDALNFFFIIPLFLIILYLSKKDGFWKMSTMTFLGAGTLIALLGILEFYIPSFRNLLPGFIQTNIEGVTAVSSDFVRASFSYFGATPAVIICALCLPMVWLVPQYYRGAKGVVLTLIVTAILVTGIYISGTRAAWLIAFVTSILIAYFALKLLGLGVAAGFWAIVASILPDNAMALVNSLLTPIISNEITDTSLLVRYNRQVNALNLAIQHPFGVGWAGSGWVHGDFTQVTANLGFLGGIVFLVWYLYTLIRGWKVYRQNPQDKIIQALLTGFVACGIILATEGVEVLTQFILPVWFVWGLLEAYIQQKSTASINS